MNIFSYTDYRLFLNEWMEWTSSGSKRGVTGKIAKQTRIHPTVLSLVLRGDRKLTSEQAYSIGEFCGLNEAELEYFLLLVQLDRAGTKSLKDFIQKKVDRIRIQRNQLIEKIDAERVLGKEERSIFYSDWVYSAVRILSFIKSYQSVDSIAKRLNLKVEQVSKVVHFLIDHGLCTQKKGVIKPGPQSTHLEATSPLVAHHHRNWRIQAMNRHPRLSLKREISYTSPVSVSRKDADQIRQLLIQTIETFCKKVDASPSEEAYFINIDWLEI